MKDIDPNWISAVVAIIALIVMVILERRRLWCNMVLFSAWIEPRLTATRQGVQRILAIARDEFQTTIELWRNRKKLLEILRNRPAVPVATSVPATPRVVTPTAAPVVTPKTAPAPVPVPVVIAPAPAPVISPKVTTPAPAFVAPAPAYMPVPSMVTTTFPDVAQCSPVSGMSLLMDAANRSLDYRPSPLLTVDNLGYVSLDNPLLKAAADYCSPVSPLQITGVGSLEPLDDFKRKYPGIFSTEVKKNDDVLVFGKNSSLGVLKN